MSDNLQKEARDFSGIEINQKWVGLYVNLRESRRYLSVSMERNCLLIIEELSKAYQVIQELENSLANEKFLLKLAKRTLEEKQDEINSL